MTLAAVVVSVVSDVLTFSDVLRLCVVVREVVIVVDSAALVVVVSSGPLVVVNVVAVVLELEVPDVFVVVCEDDVPV